MFRREPSMNTEHMESYSVDDHDHEDEVEVRVERGLPATVMPRSVYSWHCYCQNDPHLIGFGSVGVRMRRRALWCRNQHMADTPKTCQ